MKEFQEKDSYESSFFVPEEKVIYTLVIGDGVGVKAKEDGSGDVSMMIPLIATNADNQTTSIFINFPAHPDEEWKIKGPRTTLTQIASVCGLYKRLEKDFPGEQEIDAPEILKALCLWLPGKTFDGRFKLTKSKDGEKTFTRLNLIAKAGAGKKQAAGQAAAGANGKTKAGGGGTEWD